MHTQSTSRLLSLGCGLLVALSVPASASSLSTAPLATTALDAPAVTWQDAQDEPGYLGVTYAIAEGGGVQVTEVRSGTPAERSGLQAGDVLVAVDGKALEGAALLLDTLAAKGPGAKIELTLKRGDAKHVVGVALASRSNPGGETAEKEKAEKQKAEDAAKKKQAEQKAKEKAQEKKAKAEAGRDGGSAISAEEKAILESLRELGYGEAKDLAEEHRKVAEDHAKVAEEHAKIAEQNALQALKNAQQADEHKATAEKHAAEALETLRGLGYVGDTAQDDAGDEPGFLGVYPSDADGGVRVDSLVDGSAAAKGGLQAGDVLLSIDGKALATSDDLRASISGRSAGTKVALEVLRGGEKLKFKLKLGAREGDTGAPDTGDFAEVPILDVPIVEGLSGGFVSDGGAVLQQQIEAELDALRQRAQDGFGDVQALDAPPVDPNRGFLGVLLDGLTVTGTVDESGARRAGIQAGETLVSIDGEPIETLEDLQAKLGVRRPGSRTVVGLRSGEGRREVEVVLGRRPEAVVEVPEEIVEVEVEPAPLPADVLESLNNLPAESPGYLGVALSEEDGQVSVTDVLQGTPAQASGVQAGDRIAKIGDAEIHTLADLRAALANVRPGQEADLTLVRGDRLVRLSPKLAARPDAGAEARTDVADVERRERAEAERRRATEMRAQDEARERREVRRRDAEAQRQTEEVQRRRAEAERLFQRYEERRERELQTLEEQLEKRMKSMRKDLEAREKALEKELEKIRERLGDDEGVQRRTREMQERLRNWQEGNRRTIERQSEAVRERARALRGGAERRVRGQADAPVRDRRAAPPAAPEANEVRAAMRALRAEVEALREEVQNLRGQLRRQGGR